MKKIIIGILFLLSYSLCFGQQYDFVRFQESDGLPLSQIYCIYQHSNGALALGIVGGGLSLYNGTKFHNFTQNEGLGSTTVNRIGEDSKGNLWLATDDGLSKFDGKIFRNFYEKDRKVSVWELAIDKNDHVFLGTNDGVVKYDGKDFINIPIPLGKNNPNILFLQIEKSGNLIFGSSDHIWEMVDGKVTILEQFSGKYIEGIFKTNQKNILIAANDTLFSYSAGIISIRPFEKNIKIKNITYVYEDSKENLWIGTIGSGVYRISKTEISHYNKKNGFTNSPVSSIIEDSNFKMWFGTDNGLYFLNRTVLQFFPNNSTISDLWSVYVSPQNDVYVGTSEKGMFKFENNLFKEYHANKKTNSIYYQTLQDKNKDWWIATNNGLIYKSKTNSDIQRKLKIFDKENVLALYQDYKNNIWIGTGYGGLFCFDGINVKEQKIDSIFTTIEAFIEDKQNNLWIGTNVGMYKYDGKKFTYPTELNVIKRFEIDHLIFDRYRNIIWAAAFGEGLIKYNLPSDTANGTVQIYGTKEGLNDNSVLSLVEDFDGNIWTGTNEGLNKIILNETDSVISIIPFYKNDGLLGEECVQGSAEIDSTGKLLIMTAKGLLAFYPNKLGMLKKNPIPKVISIKAISLDSTVTFSKDYLFENWDNQIPIEIPGTINNFQINYCGLAFPSSKGTNFSYKLSGFNWSKPTKETTVHFNNLEPGNYNFSVRTLTAQDVPNQQIAAINFEVNAAFYQTRWFKILIFIILILLGLFLNYIRTRSIKKKNIMLRAKIEERKKINIVLNNAKEAAEKSEKLKSEFLAQMSHEIRSPIHTILSFTQLLEFEISDKIDDELKESFAAIKKAGQRVVRTIELILNMSQIQTNTLETHFRIIDLTDEILEPLYLEYYQTAKSEGLILDFIKDTEEVEIEGDEYSLTQIIANLLNNAIKYTDKGKVTLRVLRTDDNFLTVEVIDTGIGIAKEYLPNIFKSFSQEEQGYTRQYDGNGLGLSLVEKYCKINDAEISVESEKGKGSTFRVIFK